MINDYDKQKIADTTKAAFAQVIKRKGVVHIGALITVEVDENTYEQVTLHLTKQGYSHLNIGGVDPKTNGNGHTPQPPKKTMKSRVKELFKR